MNNQYKYFRQHLTARMSRELIQELFAGQSVQRQEIIRAVDEAHLERGGLPKRSIAHPVGAALSVMKANGLAESPEYGVWSILSETIDMNNRYRYFEQVLTPDIAQELIQELFEGQTVQKQEITNAVDNAHLERGGLASEDPVTTALAAMKRSGIAENPESDLERGSRAYQRREYEAAVSYFDMAIGQYPDDPEAYYQRGLAKFHLGEHEPAISDYDEAIDRDSDYAEAYYQRGLAKFHLGRYESAISDYDEVHLNLNYALKQYLERYESAIDDYNSAIRINPNYTEAYYQRGLAKHHLDHYESAISDYDEAIRLGPDDAEIYYYRAEANFSLRQVPEGKADIQMALQLAEQSDDMDIIKRIEDLLYEINPEL
ncbi:tetratricopeptide repeat protein [Candidatus Poribacteria bacterium]|nr:tetratricopeptide repeat protein [Candidatus Poribacteria bacterium]MYK22900.1 tetratricopeptide repeat protein [Candidatus Poribacteria bacterium]